MKATLRYYPHAHILDHFWRLTNSMGPDEYQALKENIRNFGIVNPFILSWGKTPKNFRVKNDHAFRACSGNNRAAVMEELGIETASAFFIGYPDSVWPDDPDYVEIEPKYAQAAFTRAYVPIRGLGGDPKANYEREIALASCPDYLAIIRSVSQENRLHHLPDEILNLTNTRSAK